MDDGIQDEMDVSSYQNKRVIDKNEKGGFNADDPSSGTNILQDLESYIINTKDSFKWKNSG